MRHFQLEDQPKQEWPSYYRKSWALVIGINDYRERHAKLANAVNDATVFGRFLEERFDFDKVVILTEEVATRKTIRDWLLDKLPDLMKPDDRLIIFFAGHGITRKDERGVVSGYLVPYDAIQGKYSSYVDMDDLKKACGWIKAKHILIVLDCCFSGVAAIAARSSPKTPPSTLNERYLEQITSRTAWQILTAGASDDLAADSGSRPGHSAFTGALLIGLEGQADNPEDGLITATELSNFIKPLVSNETSSGGREGQTPFFNYLAGSGQGDFVFVRRDVPVKIAPKAPALVTIPPLAAVPVWLWGILGILIVAVGLLFWQILSTRSEMDELRETFNQLAQVAPPTATLATGQPTDTPKPTVTSTPIPVSIVEPIIGGTVVSNPPTIPPQPIPSIALTITPIRAPELAYNGHGIDILVIASGIDLEHPDLAGQVGEVRDFSGEGNNDLWKGYITHLSGLIAGNGRVSGGVYAGIAPGATLHFALVDLDQGSPNEDLIKAVTWGIEESFDIIFIPFSSPESSSCNSESLWPGVLFTAEEAGLVVIAPTNLNGPESETIGDPGCATSVITVGYSLEDGLVAEMSGRGPTVSGVSKPDVVAIGDQLVGARSDDFGKGVPSYEEFYARSSGSGVSAAYVTGVVALMLEANPILGPTEIKETLQLSAVDLGEDDMVQGAGEVELNAAIEGAASYTALYQIRQDVTYAVDVLNDLFKQTLDVPPIVLLEDETSRNPYWDGSRFHAPPQVKEFPDITYSMIAYAFIQASVQLDYQKQSGAIQSSYSDILSELVAQRRQSETAWSADWLIGVGSIPWLYGSDVVADGTPLALRSLKAPGTAYPNDPQVAHIDDFVETGSDFGGVHINSGIPNRAFYETAVRTSSEIAGRIWIAALDHLEANSDFQDLAEATLDSATDLYGVGSSEEESVFEAWSEVGLFEGEN